jgi:hypothetical protein
VSAVQSVVAQQARKLDSAQAIRELFDRELGELVGWLYRTALHPPTQIAGDFSEDEVTPTVEFLLDDVTPIDE